MKLIMCNNKPPVKVFPPSETAVEEKIKVKKNTPAYYLCLLNESLQGWQGQPITKACHNCKQNSAKLVSQRNQEIASLMSAYQTMGESLKNLLVPLAQE